MAHNIDFWYLVFSSFNLMFHHSSQIDFANCLNSYFTKKSNESRNALIVLCTIVIITIGQEGVKGRLKVKSTWAQCGPSQSVLSRKPYVKCVLFRKRWVKCVFSRKRWVKCMLSQKRWVKCVLSWKRWVKWVLFRKRWVKCVLSRKRWVKCVLSRKWWVKCVLSRKPWVKCVLSQTAGSQMRVVPDSRESNACCPGQQGVNSGQCRSDGVDWWQILVLKVQCHEILDLFIIKSSLVSRFTSKEAKCCEFAKIIAF